MAWDNPGGFWGKRLQPATGVSYVKISDTDLKEWLSYLASDELQGRQVFTEGYGRATQYIADQLRGWGVKPIGENGTYFQPVKLKGYRVTRNSTVTVEANGQSRTFKHGDHVTFSPNSGGKQTLRFDGVEFVGYGLTSDYEGRDLKGKLIVTVPNLAPPPARGGANAVPVPPARRLPVAHAELAADRLPGSLVAQRPRSTLRPLLQLRLLQSKRWPRR